MFHNPKWPLKNFRIIDTIKISFNYNFSIKIQGKLVDIKSNSWNSTLLSIKKNLIARNNPFV